MKTDINKVKKSLEEKLRENKSLKKGEELIRKIVSDFDSISNKIQYKLPQNVTKKLIKRNSASFKNNIVSGFNKKKFNLDYIREINKQEILLAYKERNIKYWEEIIKLGFNSMAIIAWGVAYRRKAIPIFLNDKELELYGFESGIENAYDYRKISEDKYYDKTEYPATIGSIDKKWDGINLTRGMRFQCVYLFDKVLSRKIKEKNLSDVEKDNIIISLYKNPQLLEIIFESFRELELENKNKISDIEKQLIIIYENLSSEKKKAMKEKFKVIIKLKNAYKSIGYYSDVYKHANSCRRNGLSLDKGIELGIEKYKDTNLFLRDLIGRKNSDIKEVVIYLHNSYYKTKYKDFISY